MQSVTAKRREGKGGATGPYEQEGGGEKGVSFSLEKKGWRCCREQWHMASPRPVKASCWCREAKRGIGRTKFALKNGGDPRLTPPSPSCPSVGLPCSSHTLPDRVTRAASVYCSLLGICNNFFPGGIACEDRHVVRRHFGLEKTAG